MLIVAGSISLISPSGLVTRFPTNRSVGSSSSATMITLYGASSWYAGSSGGWGTMNDQIVPRPDVGSQRNSSERHRGHIGRGGIRRSPQLLHIWTSSSPRAQPDQNSAASGSSTSGSRKSASTSLPPQQKRARGYALAARHQARLRSIDLARRRAAHLAHAL